MPGQHPQLRAARLSPDAVGGRPQPGDHAHVRQAARQEEGPAQGHLGQGPQPALQQAHPARENQVLQNYGDSVM